MCRPPSLPVSLPKGTVRSNEGRTSIATLDHGVSCCPYNGIVPFVIRDFRPEDFETLWQIDQDCFPPGIAYSRQELKVYVRRRGSFTAVAEDAATRKIAGFIVAYGGLTGHVITIDVIPSARRAGVGSLLLRVAEDRLRAGGAKAVSLETAVDNLAALAFYKRHGYSVVRTWPRYYSNGVDALVLRKDLLRKSATQQWGGPS
jgi:ribosomal-protein-alanine N-acetyltransferase